MPKTDIEKESKIDGITYIILVLGIFGWAIDALVYLISKNKHTKLHALQSCFIALAATIILIPLAFVFSYSLLAYQTAIQVILIIIYIFFAFSVFSGKDIRIPFIVKIIEHKKTEVSSRKTSPQEPRKSRGSANQPHS